MSDDFELESDAELLVQARRELLMDRIDHALHNKLPVIVAVAEGADTLAFAVTDIQDKQGARRIAVRSTMGPRTQAGVDRFQDWADRYGAVLDDDEPAVAWLDTDALAKVATEVQIAK